MIDTDKIMNIIPATEKERDLLSDNLVKFNAQQVPFSQKDVFTNVDYVAKDGDRIIGGITSMMYCWKCLYIDILWVDEKYRHAGLGSKLIKMVEQHAKESGCHLSHLDTFDFQAKDFYLKHGYEIFGVLVDCPPGHKRYYLKKHL